MREKTRVPKGLLMTVLFFAVCTFFVAPVYAAEVKASVVRDTPRALIDEYVQQLAENAEAYEAYRDVASDFLQEESIGVLDEVLFIAQLDISPEEKGGAVIEIAQSSCLTFAQLWVIGLILDYVDVLGTLSSLLKEIGVFGILLCLLGSL